jgi:iron complex transport system substrate-binding protein
MRLIAAHVHADPEPLITRMEAAIAATQARTAHIPSVQRPLIYCEEWGKPLIHSQHWVAELVEVAGGRFLGTPGSHTTPEEVAAADPDVLLFAWCGAGDRVPLGRVIAQRNWHGLRAVRNGRVHCIPDEYLNTPAPTLMEGLACIAAAVHPSLHPLDSRLISLGAETTATSR